MIIILIWFILGLILGNIFFYLAMDGYKGRKAAAEFLFCFALSIMSSFLGLIWFIPIIIHKRNT